MKITSILFSFSLAFKTIYSKAIDNKITLEQLNIPEEDNSFKLVEREDFIYKFHCSEDDSICGKIQNDLNFALDKLSDTFEFYQPVVFEVFVDDLTGKYGFRGILAGVTDQNYVPLRTSKDKSEIPYLYPQSLIKQLKLNKQPKYKKNDFLVIINNKKVQNNEIRSILIHEMLHGLGFMSTVSIKKLTNNYVFSITNPTEELHFNETEKYVFLPNIFPLYSEKLIEITDEEEYIDQLYNTEFSKFLPFTVFDKNLVSLKSSEKIFGKLKTFYKEANKKCLPKDGSPLLMKDSNNKYVSDCFDNLSSKTQKIITDTIKERFFEFQSLGILTKDGDTIPLQTFNGTFAPGSSISHPVNPLYDEAVIALSENRTDFVNAVYNGTSHKFYKEAVSKYYDDNYILYYADNDDLTVEEMLELLPNNKKHPLIGNGIVKVLETLGWTEKGKRRSNKTYYLDESINIPEAKNFEFIIKKIYEFSYHDTFSTIIKTEITSAYFMEEEPTSLIEEEPTFPAEEVETTSPVEEEPTFLAEEVETLYLVDEVPTIRTNDELDEDNLLLPVDEVETFLPLYDDDEPTPIENPLKYLIQKLKDLFESLFH